jgi:hypothetical protein
LLVKGVLEGKLDNSLSEVIVISIDISRGGSVSAGDQCNLRLLSLALLACLIGRFLLLHLLVAQRSQATGDLLDLITWEILSQLLGELLQEDNVVSLLGVIGENWNKCFTELLELEFSLGIEEGESSQVDSRRWVLGINNNGVCCSGNFAAIANTDVAK